MLKSDDVCVGGCVRMLHNNVGRNLVLIGLRRAAYVARVVETGGICFLKGGHLEDCLMIYTAISKVEVSVAAYM
jgi:hypothetical protein